MRSPIKCAGILVCLFLSAACAKEQINSVEEPSHAQEWDASKYLLGFDASMEDMTKAEIDFSSGSVTWTNGDKVLVVAGTTSAEYAWDGSAFKPQNTPVEFGSDPAYAYFPADCFTVSGGEVSFTMPQALAADPGKKLPMAGIIPAGVTSPVCYFKQLGSVVWVKARASRANGETLTKVRVVNSSLSLSGTGTVTWDGTTSAALPQLGVLTVKDAENNDVPGPKEAACTDSHKLDNTTDVDYYVFVPAGNLENIELQFVYGKGALNVETMSHDYEPYQSMARNSDYLMARGKVLPVHGIVLSGFFSGGDGSETYPYQLSSLADLQKLAELSISSEPSSGYSTGKPSAFSATCIHYALTTDIDLDGEDWTPIGFDHEGTASTGNGNNACSPGKQFRGTFDGQNHEIQNFNPTVTLANGKTYGFFGAIREATIKNLIFTNVDVTYGAADGAAADAGILAGTIGYGSTVENITIDGQLTSTGTATDNKRLALGGIAGFAFASVRDEVIHDTYIKNCDVTLNITGDSGSNTKAGATAVHAAALVGFSTVNAADSEARVHIENCTVQAATIDIKCGRASALVAAATAGTILDGCVNYANVSNSFTNGRIGGLVCMQGPNSGLEDCVNRGNVTTTNNKTTTGGMVALIQGDGAYIRGGGNYGTVTSNFATDGSGRDFYGLVGANLNTFASIDGVTVSGKLYKNGGSTLIDVTAENFIDNNYIGWWNNAENKAKITNCTYVAP